MVHLIAFQSGEPCDIDRLGYRKGCAKINISTGVASATGIRFGELSKLAIFLIIEVGALKAKLSHISVLMTQKNFII